LDACWLRALETSVLHPEKAPPATDGAFFLVLMVSSALLPITRNSAMGDLDHRNLGVKLKLWHFQEDAPGMVFWHPRCYAVYRVLED
jgi:hypothetical protein